MKKTPAFLLLFLLIGCGTALSEEERFISATATMACLKTPASVSENANEADREQALLQKKMQQMDDIARQNGFQDKNGLDTLAQKYQQDQAIITRVREKMKQLCGE